MDEAVDEVLGKSDEKKDITNSAMAAPRWHVHERRQQRGRVEHGRLSAAAITQIR